MNIGNTIDPDPELDPMPNDIENPFDSLITTIACSPNDWALNGRMAWIYGITCGWGKSLKSVGVHHGWTPQDMRRLKRLHTRFKAANHSFDLDKTKKGITS